jgi:hypothetical protein
MDTIRRTRPLIALVLAIFAHVATHAADFTYNFNYAGLTGTIVTSCDRCAVGPNDLVSWMFSGQGPNGPVSINSSGSDAEERSVGAGLLTTPTNMTYAFTPASADEAVFYENSNSLYLVSFPTEASQAGNDQGEWGVCNGGFPFSGENGGTPEGTSLTCQVGITTGVQTVAQIAQVATAPELDPRALATSLTLLIGSIAVLRGRQARRRPR